MAKLFSLAAVMCVAGSVMAETSDVLVYTDANFDDMIKQEGVLHLVEFYAPWCGHCKSLAPHYEKAATALKAEFPNVRLAKVDATEEKKVAEKFGIQGFPTLKWFVNGEAKEYGGGRTDETIISWIRKKVGPSAKTITTEAELEAFKTSADVTVVGLFGSEAESKAYMKVTSEVDDIPFAIVTGDAVATLGKALCDSGAPAVVLFKKFDEGKAVYSGDFSDDASIAKFVNGNALPLITPFTQESAQKIFGGSIKQHLLLFIDKADVAGTKVVLDAASPVARANKGEYLFVSVDKTDARILEFFGITEKNIPTARVVELGDAGMKKYKIPSDSLTTESLTSFVAEHKAGKIPVDLKSEDIPAKQEGDVFVLVAKQYEEIVVKSGKNVLLEIYAPWCGHCKKLAPIWDELAAKYKGNDNLIIAKMDGTLNEVEAIQVQGFPTLKFFPAGGEAVDYNDGRDLEALSKFLEEQIPGLKAATK